MVAFTAIMILGLTLVLAPLIVLLAVEYPPAHGRGPGQAGVLDSTALSDKPGESEFRKQVHLAVLTVPVRTFPTSTMLC